MHEENENRIREIAYLKAEKNNELEELLQIPIKKVRKPAKIITLTHIKYDIESDALPF